MNREEFFYLLPYVFSLALSLGVFIYTWQHRYVRGARLYSWFVGGQTLTILAFIFELVSPNLQTKLLWDKFQWLTDSFLVILPFLLFSVQFSEYKLRYPRATWGCVLIFPVIFAAFTLTDNLHHLIYPDPHLSTDYPFPELQYKFTIIVYGYALVYLYIANLYGIGLLIRRAVQPNNLYRSQYWTIIAGFLIPLTLSTFAFADITITPQRDITPFSLAIGNAIVAWGLFRYRLFDIVPIAREWIIENMLDPVVVLDSNNRVVDINPAALKALGKQNSKVIGRSANEVFEYWPVIVKELDILDIDHKEIAIHEADSIFFYDLNISPIYNKHQQLTGRVIVARDITRHKTLETGYRVLSQELDQRVKERTDELHNIAERYRAVVENQTEFIVRWKTDGTRTFANEAYCRYWGLTFEEALAVNFFSHILEEDRQAVDEKISRLISGQVVAKTEIHRVMKPDGSIAWHEWTDQVIRSGTGKLIEIQSVGRDITERKLAEKALRENEEKLRTLFNILPVGISILDKDRQITEMNPRLQEILKIPAKKLLEGKSQQRKYIKSDGTPISAEEFPSTRALTEQKQVLNNELGILKDDGEIIWVNVSAAPLPGFGVTVTTTDITERKRAEEALRESEAIYRKAIEVAGAVPYRQSYPGEEFHIDYDFIGDGIRQITGYGPDEFHEDLWDALVQESHPTGELAQYSWSESVHRVRTGASPIWQCEHRIRARNGETRWVYEAAVELRNKDGQSHGSIGMFQDITERKRTEEIILNQLAFDSLITKLLNKLSSSTGIEIDTIIESGLQEIAKFIGADHAYVIVVAQDRLSWSLTYEWCASPILSFKAASQKVSFSEPVWIWSEKKILAGEEIRINTLDDLPQEAIRLRKFCETEGALSFLNVPISGPTSIIIGSVGLDSHARPTTWTDSDVTRLKIVGDAIANTLERKRAQENLADAYDTTLEGWAKALELRDKETEGHSRRVTETTLAVARAMGFNEEELVHIRRGSILHDIGKMGIPDQILRKEGPLTEKERQIVLKHPDTAYNLLKQISYLEKALEIPHSHHEKWDGTGYPRGLAGEDIPLSARIFAIVDVWDALLSDRPYRKAWNKEAIIEYIRKDSGKHFDPHVVDVFLAMAEKGEI